MRLHWRTVLHLGYLRSVVAVVLWDALLASLAYVVLIPVLAVAIDPLVLLAYLVDAPVVLVPVVWQALSRRETGLAGQLPELLRAAARQRAVHAAGGVA